MGALITSMSSNLLSQEILESLRGYTENLKHSVDLVIQNGEHPKRQELCDFLQGISEVSEKLNFKEEDLDSCRSAITFEIRTNDEPTGISFSGIPSGHEFNSLILAILQSGGSEIKLDENIKRSIESIDENLQFEVFVSLSCHNCPEIVQTLNQFSLLNPKIKTEMIDGGLFQDTIEERGIQGVPSVYMNGEVFANGKVEISGMIERLESKIKNQEEVAENSLPTQGSTYQMGSLDSIIFD